MDFAIAVYDQTDVYIDTENFEPWMSISQIADILGLNEKSVKMAISRAKKRGDQITEHDVRIATPGGDQYIKLYNVDVLLLVGFRAQNNERVIAFRAWVSSLVRDALMEEYRARLQLENENRRLQFEIEQEQIAAARAQIQAEYATYELRDAYSEIAGIYPDFADYDENGEIINF